MTQRIILTDDDGLVVNLAVFKDDFKGLLWDGLHCVRAQAAQEASVNDHWDGRRLQKAPPPEPPPMSELEILKERIAALEAKVI